MSQEIQQSLIGKINETHADCLACDTDIREVILRKVNKARECGIYLQELRESTPHGQWGDLFASDSGKPNQKPVFVFTAETARNYIRFAGANKEAFTELTDGIRSVKDAMIASGALPARTHENQNLHANESNFFISAGKQLMAFGSLWDKQEKHHPVSAWTPETAEAFVAQMEPVIEKVNTIYALAKEKALQRAA